MYNYTYNCKYYSYNYMYQYLYKCMYPCALNVIIYLFSSDRSPLLLVVNKKSSKTLSALA